MTALETRLIAYGVIAFLVITSILGGIAYVVNLRHEVTAAQVATAAAQAQDKHDAGQAALAAGVVPIVQAGAAKADLTVHVQSENSNALAQAPGAAAPVDPALLAVAIHGLCKYEAYAGDPACAGVPAANPAGVQQTH